MVVYANAVELVIVFMFDLIYSLVRPDYLKGQEGDKAAIHPIARLKSLVWRDVNESD